MTPPIVKRYLIAFEQHKWTGLAAFVMVLAGSGIFAAMQKTPPTEYQAKGGMMVVQPPLILSETGTSIQQQAQTLSQEALLTEPVIKTLVERTKVTPKQLEKNLVINLPKPAAPAGRNAPPPPPPKFGIQYTDSEKARTKLVVETLMSALVEQSRLVNSQRLRGRLEVIKQRLPMAEKDLRKAENQLEKFIRQEGVKLLAARDGSVVNGITGSQAQQRQMEYQLDGINAQIRSLQQRLGLTPDQAYTSSALSADPIIASLRAQIYQTESQLALLKKDYREEHPNVINLRKQQQIYERMLRERAGEVIGNNGIGKPLVNSNKIRQESSLDPSRQQLAQQLVALQTQKETLEQQKLTLARQEQELRREYLTIPNKQLEQVRLQQEVNLKQTFYNKLQAMLIDAQAAEAEIIATLTITEPASVTENKPPAQNVALIVVGGAGIGLLVGGGLIFLLGSLGGMLQTMEDIRAALVQRDVEVLGILPYIMVLDPEGGEMPIIVEPDSPYLELYERFRSNLRRASDKPVKVVLFTSTASKEGKSISAYNLAIAAARAGKRTLLIEADLRSPSLANTLKVAPEPDAAVEPLRYYGSLSECIRLVPEVENLYLVPSPGPMRQPAAILESSEFNHLLEDARGRFDMVVLDTPSLSLCNDALLLEPLTDGMILVTRPGFTGANMLAEAADQLSESEDLRLLGAIINGADIPLPRPAMTEVAKEFEEEEEEESVPTRSRKK